MPTAPAPGDICSVRIRTHKGPRVGPGLVVIPTKAAELTGYTTVALGTHRTDGNNPFSPRPTEYIAYWRSSKSTHTEFTILKPYVLCRIAIDQIVGSNIRGDAQDRALKRFRKRLPLFLWNEAELATKLPELVIDDYNRETENKRAVCRCLTRGTIVNYNGNLYVIVSNQTFNRHLWVPRLLALQLVVSPSPRPQNLLTVSSRNGQVYAMPPNTLFAIDFMRGDSIAVESDIAPIEDLSALDSQISQLFRLG